MTAGHYPRTRLKGLITTGSLQPSYRIFPGRFIDSPLGTAPADSRFCSRASGYTILYAAPDFRTAFTETIVRDRFTRKTARPVALREITARAWALIASEPDRPLSLLDLREDGCVRIGAPTDAVNARNHAAGRMLGLAIYSNHEDIDGVVFQSRLTGASVYAIFDRAFAKLVVQSTGKVEEHPELVPTLERHEIQLTLSD